MPEIISVHDVWEPLKQPLLASRDVIISSQICVSKLQRFFTLGDGCWLPKKIPSQKGPKGHKCAQMQTIVHELQRVALSLRLRAPIWTFPRKPVMKNPETQLLKRLERAKAIIGRTVPRICQ